MRISDWSSDVCSSDLIQFLKPDLELARSTYQFRSIIERAAARRYAETGDAERARELIDGHKALMARIEKDGLTDSALEALEVLEVGLHGRIIATMKTPLIETTAQPPKNYGHMNQTSRNGKQRWREKR